MLLQHIRPIHESVRDHKKLSKMYFKMGELQKKITDQVGVSSEELSAVLLLWHRWQL